MTVVLLGVGRRKKRRGQRHAQQWEEYEKVCDVRGVFVWVIDG